MSPPRHESEAPLSSSLFINRQALHLRPDPTRVVVRPFRPATEPRDLNPTDRTRANHIVDRALALDSRTLDLLMADVLENFAGRHRDLVATFEARADDMDVVLHDHPVFTRDQKRLVGAYFMHEYAFESSALFNPSIVAHPDQSGVPAGGRRFVLSLRAVGEGHISSLTFRSCVIDAAGTVVVEPASRLASLPVVTHRSVVAGGEVVEVVFDPSTDLSERVIFPLTPTQSNGIEDARFVAFDEDGRTVYRATYTAYNGTGIRSEMIETSDFLRFRLSPMTGAATRNKGMGLFPRRLDGRYAMIGRQDNENLHLILSDDLHHWAGGRVIVKPMFPWEFVQIGTCGSPIELDEGWLLFTHGVGPVRRYAIGAVLLDKTDLTKVLGRSREPLVRPAPEEREGYVPNVVYTCGAIRHADSIILPYAVSDTFSTVATMPIDDLLVVLRGLD